MKQHQWLLLLGCIMVTTACAQEKQITGKYNLPATITSPVPVIAPYWGKSSPAWKNISVAKFDTALGSRIIINKTAFTMIAATKKINPYSGMHQPIKAIALGQPYLHSRKEEESKIPPTIFSVQSMVNRYTFSDSQHPYYNKFPTYTNAHAGNYPPDARRHFGYTKGEKAMILLGTIMNAVQTDIINSLARSRLSKR